MIPPAPASSASVAPKSKVVQWVEDHTDRTLGTDPGAFDPDYVREILHRLRWLYGERDTYFRLDVRGWDNVPEAPALIVSNHSGGTSIPDVWGLALAWHKHFAITRPLHVLAHEMVFTFEATGRPLSKAGVLRANPWLGKEVLTRWRRDLLVMPGGDVDVWRPYRERYKVKFAGRKGYARLALRTGVPVVPVANAGAHEGLLVLTDGQAVARMLRFPKLFRARIFPVSLSFPWGLAIGPWPHIPPPSRLRYRIGKPIYPPGRIALGKDVPEALVDEHDARVQAAVQGLLDELKAEEH